MILQISKTTGLNRSYKEKTDGQPKEKPLASVGFFIFSFKKGEEL
jgi:hypothetical protein